MSAGRFDAMYAGTPPWEIGRPQPEVVRIAAEGGFTGRVLDVGCGTGENALMLASLGLHVLGIDVAPAAVARARRKAAERSLDVDFRIGNALNLVELGMEFDSALDSGVFHVFSDAERRVYVRQLASVLRSHGVLRLICFSEWEPGDHGPRRVSQSEILDAFAEGWTVESIVAARYEVSNIAGGPQFSPGGAQAWLATVRRSADPVGKAGLTPGAGAPNAF